MRVDQELFSLHANKNKNQQYHFIEREGGSGTLKLTSSTCLNPRLGFQSFLSVFTQISPFAAMLG